jgi:predicted type IV restriction endonuclease
MEPVTSQPGKTGPKWEVDARNEIRAQIRKFTPPLRELVARDANEGDTRVVVTDILCDALGYDKYEDLTTEYAVRGEFADYGIRIDKQLVAFVEVKRAAQQLNIRHLHQVEAYAMKEGVEWVILTNGRAWAAYHVETSTGVAVVTHLVLEVDLLDDSTTATKADGLFFLHKSAMKREKIDELWRQKAATSPEALAKVLLSDAVVDAARMEVRRRSGYNPEVAALAKTIRTEVVREGLV